MHTVYRIVDWANSSVHFLKRLMHREDVVGAAYLLGNIYVVVKGSCYVLVYTGHNPYELTEKIYVDGLHPADIATSYADICVYILDASGRVKRIGHDHAVSTVIYGLTRGYLLSRMSVAEDGRIVIVERSSKVTTYTKDGTFLKSMSVPLDPPTLHAVEVAEAFVVCTESAVTKSTTGGTLLDVPQKIGYQYISIDRRENLIACDCVKHEIVELDSESLKVTDTLLTLDRDGIESPRHVQCVLENGMMLVCWGNCLDVYSFIQSDTQGYLAASEDDIRMQRTREAELLEREIADNNDAFKQLYRTPELRNIFGDLSRPQELQSAAFLGEDTLHYVLS